MTMPLEVRDLWYRYPGSGEDILRGVNLTVERGEVLAVVGLSGSGKSTLCYCLSGIVPHIYSGNMRGEVLIKGTPTTSMKIPQIATRLGIVFQEPDTQLFSPTVEDEVVFGPENLCLPREEIGERLKTALKQVGMEEFRLSSPNQLSGGQKQLIALASVLSLDPEILIFDEAMSQIDAQGKEAIKEAVSGLRNRGKTVVMIEHDLDNLDVADRVLLLRDGVLQPFEGRL
ncbi:MAG: ABC transporter ATP-binding protein [Clostridiales bacterium]|jgi:energy-coupling factor transport system ATP-binding protein|nr:ABC transporter ATP-binding protein [Clostridiales bacterium]